MYKYDIHASLRLAAPERHRRFMETCCSCLLSSDRATLVRGLRVTSIFATLAMSKARELDLLKGEALPHGYLGLGKAIKVRAVVMNGGSKKDPFTVDVRSNDTLRVLRAKLLEAISAQPDLTDRVVAVVDVETGGTTDMVVGNKRDSAVVEGAAGPPSEYKLFAGKELTYKDDDVLICALGVVDNTTISCMCISKKTAPTSTPFIGPRPPQQPLLIPPVLVNCDGEGGSGFNDEMNAEGDDAAVLVVEDEWEAPPVSPFEHPTLVPIAELIQKVSGIEGRCEDGWFRDDICSWIGDTPDPRKGAIVKHEDPPTPRPPPFPALCSCRH